MCPTKLALTDRLLVPPHLNCVVVTVAMYCRNLSADVVSQRRSFVDSSSRRPIIRSRLKSRLK